MDIPKHLGRCRDLNDHRLRCCDALYILAQPSDHMHNRKVPWRSPQQAFERGAVRHPGCMVDVGLRGDLIRERTRILDHELRDHEAFGTARGGERPTPVLSSFGTQIRIQMHLRTYRSGALRRAHGKPCVGSPVVCLVHDHVTIVHPEGGRGLSRWWISVPP